MNHASEDRFFIKDSPSVLKKPLPGEKMFQSNFLKGIIICLFIIDHSLPADILLQIQASFWIKTAIPLSLILIGFNCGLSFRKYWGIKKIFTLKELYNWKYIQFCFKHYIIPFLFLYGIDVIIWFIFRYFRVPTFYAGDQYENSAMLFLGYTPFWGPGMQLIPTICTGILIFPLIYYLYQRNHTGTMIGTIFLELYLHVSKSILYFYVVPSYDMNLESYYFISTHILYMISGISIGLWLIDGYGWKHSRNRFLWILFPISLIFMGIYAFFPGTTIHLLLSLIFWGDINFFNTIYSAILFIFIFNVFPTKISSPFGNELDKISNSVFRIFLVQILYFSFIYHLFIRWEDGLTISNFHYLWLIPVNLICNLSLGVGWLYIEQKYLSISRFTKANHIIKKILLLFACIFFIARIVTSYVFVIFLFP